MANHMEEVAKILGVSLGERFKIDFCGQYENNKYDYYLTDRGVVLDRAGRSCVSADALFKLICGEWTIVRKPYKPQKYDTYWCVCSDGHVGEFVYRNDMIERIYYKLGNCYRTKEEAEANRDKWITFFESDEVLEV